MMLDQCRRDFSALIERINVQDAFEKADYKDRYDYITCTLEILDLFVRYYLKSRLLICF